MTLRTVRVPDRLASVFAEAERVVDRYFASRTFDPAHGRIEISGERYVLVRAASLSVEFVGVVCSLYGPGREAEADVFARNILFDLAHAIGKSDAKSFHAKMKLEDPIARLSAGPVHFAHAGWAFVDIHPSSAPQPNEDFALVYDHPYSFEADAWLSAQRQPSFPACVMNAGYSSGWCEESFGVRLVATEILCKARGDEACRFVMAHPSRLEELVTRYKEARPDLAAHVTAPDVPELFSKKRAAEVQAQKLEAVGRLAGGIAHDFNNLLGVILGRSSMIQARVAKDDPLWNEMEAIRSACRQGASLTRHLMAFSRREPAVARPIDLNELIRSAQHGPLAVIGEDVEIVLDVGDDALCVLGDHAQLEQLLVNLVVNARDAMPNGGTLTIATRGADLPETTTGTGVIEPGAYVVLLVGDTGVGMSAETVSRIFDPFFSTKPYGTGLGLSTVYGTIRDARGGINVRSQPRRGTTFELFFPRCELVPEAHPDTGRAPASVVRGAAKVLVVEDQEDLRATIEEALVDAGYHVAAVGDPLKALAMIDAGLELDVLVTDLVMPKMGGRELAARVHAVRPHARILYISGYDPERHLAKHEPQHAPPGRLLEKPFSIEELTDELRALLA